jgi:hypothetical protein
VVAVRRECRIEVTADASCQVGYRRFRRRRISGIERHDEDIGITAARADEGEPLTVRRERGCVVEGTMVRQLHGPRVGADVEGIEVAAAGPLGREYEPPPVGREHRVIVESRAIRQPARGLPAGRIEV